MSGLATGIIMTSGGVCRGEVADEGVGRRVEKGKGVALTGVSSSGRRSPFPFVVCRCHYCCQSRASPWMECTAPEPRPPFSVRSSPSLAVSFSSSSPLSPCTQGESEPLLRQTPLLRPRPFSRQRQEVLVQLPPLLPLSLQHDFKPDRRPQTVHVPADAHPPTQPRLHPQPQQPGQRRLLPLHLHLQLSSLLRRRRPFPQQTRLPIPISQ